MDFDEIILVVSGLHEDELREKLLIILSTYEQSSDNQDKLVREVKSIIRELNYKRLIYKP
ncbi:hypothetical protein [Solibacillus sp. CAU 1738]|uniref:hypothetical protein n=1 Tax=Solibacillus sp. CAU 1738 TaxID=3140363 RepID=UPI003261BC50